ncbi:DUF72 domain-containing protein [Tenacibaculum sp. HL-MS23]|uniref:DUF72 domain-containing protein n=1 Tax=Tenacibaculum sp. HL-MS23 TaxID=3077734 RepID=UPI0028FC31BE|nr:DUF72 domain-containing protein [Tenacibaculum sp. HL-MS23]WNW02276.1 DUF72 domain-containing protein [Tenacibaculum sp. HL-MS23]
MQFGKVELPELVDFSLPCTHERTIKLLNSFDDVEKSNIYVGCAKWNKADLKGFYPKGTKDELGYYSKQFNSIELNATFYRLFSAEQFEKWKLKTPKGFKFFPKLTQDISHFKRLQGTQDFVNSFLDNSAHLQDRLGTIFLQMHADFGPENFKALKNFVISWPKAIPLAIEVRHEEWFLKTTVFDEFTQLLQENNIANILVDTAGRRDMLHMRLTNNEAFIRFVGANHPSDYERLDAWVIRLKEWNDLGLKKIHFFIHQNIELESPLLGAYFIKKLNKELGTNLKVPNENTQQQMSLL